jgi:hypothetical protein
MNVLLAEANIPYDKLREMDDVNPEMEQYDVALVIGANDVVNPVARTDPNSPIAGMPIIDVDKSRTCVVVKRSLSPGFAGIPNPLFAAENTLMMFGDGKKAMLELISRSGEFGSRLPIVGWALPTPCPGKELIEFPLFLTDPNTPIDPPVWRSAPRVAPAALPVMRRIHLKAEPTRTTVFVPGPGWAGRSGERAGLAFARRVA